MCIEDLGTRAHRTKYPVACSAWDNREAGLRWEEQNWAPGSMAGSELGDRCKDGTCRDAVEMVEVGKPQVGHCCRIAGETILLVGCKLVEGDMLHTEVDNESVGQMMRDELRSRPSWATLPCRWSAWSRVVQIRPCAMVETRQPSWRYCIPVLVCVPTLARHRGSP